MPDNADTEEYRQKRAIFTWKNYPWLLLLALLAINAFIYQSMFDFMGGLWWLLGPLLTVQIWALGALLFMHKLKNSDRYYDALVRGRRVGFLILGFFYVINCLDNLYRILILKQLKYYRQWEPIQPDQSIWSSVVFNVLGVVICGTLVIWAIHQFWRSCRAK